MQVVEIQAKTPLNKIKSYYLPYKWDLNVYRGCGHRCVYCYALYSHKYLDSDDFFDQIYVKTNISELLDQKLSSKRWRHDLINLGGVTDSYQPLEKNYKLMPKVWEVLIKHRNPACILTKSNLILRDIELIKKLSSITEVTVGATVTTPDEKIRKLIEPNSAPFLERLKMLRRVKKETKAKVIMMIMPILPFITDSRNNLDVLFALARKCPVDYVMTSSLNLYSDTKKYFYQFLEAKYPELISKYRGLYRSGRVNKSYQESLKRDLVKIRRRYF